jgi:hypothetical protein
MACSENPAAVVKISGIPRNQKSIRQSEHLFIKNQVVAASFGSH